MKLFRILLLFAILLSISSCQSDVEKADSLRLENKFDEAAQLYQQAADEGDAYAMWRLSKAYGNGDGVDFNQEKAFELLKKAAKGGCKEAECDLAFAYMFGWFGISAEPAKGKKMFDELIKDQDNSYIQARYAGLLLSGADGLYEKNAEKGLRILKQIKDKDNPFYLYLEGTVYATGIEDIDRDYSKAIDYFTQSYEKGRRYCASIIAQIYFDKNNKELYNIEKGIEWLKKGVKSNSTDAMLMLSSLYLISENDSVFKSYRNPNKGIELLEKAASHGSGKAYYRLAYEYYSGLNVSKDDHQDYEYNKKAYELGDASGAYNLGANYAKGTGCEKNIHKAIDIWEKAVKLGSGYAAQNLYLYYRYGGDGLPENYDREKAKYYLLEGARLNDPTACCSLSYQYYPGGDLFEENAGQAFIYAKKSAEAGYLDGCRRVAYLLDHGIGCPRNPQEAQKYRDKYEVQKKENK